MSLRFNISTDPIPADREPPEGGWKPVCRVEDHTWQVAFEYGEFGLTCVDSHTEDQINEMEPHGGLPGCYVETEYLAGSTPTFRLKWASDCPKQGFNDSGSHGHGCDCDHWLEPIWETT